jgi:hypothetical protein
MGENSPNLVTLLATPFQFPKKHFQFQIVLAFESSFYAQPLIIG